MTHLLDYVTGLELTGWMPLKEQEDAEEARLPSCLGVHPPRTLCSHEEDLVLPASTLWPHSDAGKVAFPGQSLALGSHEAEIH